MQAKRAAQICMVRFEQNGNNETIVHGFIATNVQKAGSLRCGDKAYGANLHVREQSYRTDCSKWFKYTRDVYLNWMQLNWFTLNTENYALLTPSSKSVTLQNEKFTEKKTKTNRSQNQFLTYSVTYTHRCFSGSPTVVRSHQNKKKSIGIVFTWVF